MPSASRTDRSRACRLAFLGSSAAASAQTRGKGVQRLPQAIIGLWAYEPADCDNPDSDGHLTIEKRMVLFFASGYDISAWCNGRTARGARRVSARRRGRAAVRAMP